MTNPQDPRTVWAQFPFEVWFTFNGERRCRSCRNGQERDDALTYLEAVEGVSDIDVIERET